MANINSKFIKISHRSFTAYMFYRNMVTIIPSTKRRIINETFTNNYKNKFNERYARTFLNRFDKRIMKTSIGQKTDTIRKRFMRREVLM